MVLQVVYNIKSKLVLTQKLREKYAEIRSKICYSGIDYYTNSTNVT